jgi:MFS transporter, DHA1 family, inner membrane transport protein
MIFSAPYRLPGPDFFMPIALFAMALAAFSIGTTEFVISGLLPVLSDDLSVSIPTAGLLVTGYAIGVAVGGPIIAVLLARFSRKPVIVVLAAVFTLGQVLCALAPDYGLLLGARLVSAAAHGVFFGVGSVAVAHLVPPERRGAALSLFIGGITVANILGLPAGTAIGNAFGWRATFWCIAALAGLATIAIAMLLPQDRSEDEAQPNLISQLRELRHQQVWTSYVVITLVMIGALSFAVYQVPAMIEIAGVSPDLVPLYLLAGGAGSVIGILVGGRLADWKLMHALVGALLLQIVFNATLLWTVHDPILIGVNLFIVSAVTFGFGTPNQLRILNTARAAPNMASTLISTAYNIGIAGGAFLGAMLLNAGVGYALLPGVAIGTSLLATGVALLSWRAERTSVLAAA